MTESATDNTNGDAGAADGDSADSTSVMGRRSILARMWAAGGALIAAAGGWTTWDLLRPLTPVGGFGGVVRGAASEAVTEGAIIEVAAARSFLTRIDGEIMALSEKCTHLGCRVPYCDSSGRFECPCHGSVFSRAGDYIAGPAPRGMDRHPVEEVDGLLWIDTGERIEGGAPGDPLIDEPARGPACAGEGH